MRDSATECVREKENAILNYWQMRKPIAAVIELPYESAICERRPCARNCAAATDVPI